MINNISEGAMRTAAKVDPGGTIHDKELTLQKTEQVRQVRPVEKSESGSQTDKKKSKKEDSSQYVVAENKVVYEKYDSNGDLVLRIPPSVKPIDEHA